MVSSMSSTPYYEKMEKNNKMDIDNNINASTELSYETPQEKEICLGKATENQTNTRPPYVNLTDNTIDQCVSGKHPTSTITSI